MARWRQVNRFVARVLPSMRRSQQTTSTALLTGLLHTQKVGLTSIACGMQDETAVKHRIKRAGRFCRNPRIDMQGVFNGLGDYLLARKQQNVIALDWTDLGDYMLLKASLIFRKRALPLAWRFVWKQHYDKSQNDEEEKLVEQLIEAVGTRSWVLVADRGFGRTEFFRWLDERGVAFVIRVSGTAWMEHQWFTGRIENVPRRPGGGWMYKGVWYRKRSPVRVNLACYHKEPAPAPWYLVTNLDISARQAAKLYEKRMGIEEGIRDCKSGLGLKYLWLSSPERMDRAMILIALAVLLATLTAAKSCAKGEQLKLSNNKRKKRVLSFFVLGMRIIQQHPSRLSIARCYLHAP